MVQVTLALAAAAAVGTTSAQLSTITSVTTSGPGCPIGSLQATINPQQPRVVLPSFRELYANNGDQANRQRNCNVNIGISIPPGVRIGLYQNEIKGQARIDGGVNAQLFYSVHFASQAAATYTYNQAVRNGGFTIPAAALRSSVLSSCGGDDIITVSNRVALSGEGNGQIWGSTGPNVNYTLFAENC